MENPHRATIPPVPEGGERPLWSVMIPTYNCAPYLRETLRSVLGQDPGPQRMQVEVVDDASTLDDPEAVVREVGGGRVGFFRQPGNVGHVRNFETCLRRSRGRLIHLLHGDDVVRPGFYSAMEGPFERNPELGAAFCRQIFADEDGHWRSITGLEREAAGVMHDAVERLASRQRIQPPAMVVRRSVYESLGGYDRRIRHAGEDWEMWLRIAARYPVWYDPEPLAVYRLRGGSLARRSMLTGENVSDLRTALAIAEEELARHLPAERAKRLVDEGRRDVARRALHDTRRMLRAGLPDAAKAQAWEAARTDRSPGTLVRAAVGIGWCKVRKLIGLPGAREG